MKVIKSKYILHISYYNYKINIIVISSIYDSVFSFYKNGQLHREDGPAIRHTNKNKAFYFNDEYFGVNNFTNKQWKKFVKALKHKEKMEIFK